MTEREAPEIPFNGAGVFSPYTPGFPAITGTIISSSAYNNVINDVATGLSTAVTRDGQTTLSANIPMWNFKLTGMAAGATAGDSVRFEQLQNITQNWVVAGGTADVITATYSPAVASLVDGQLFFVRATAANATTTPTFSPNGLTARTITRLGGTALIAGDIPGATAEVILRYNLANTRYELLNPAAFAARGANADITSMTALTAPTVAANPLRAGDLQTGLVIYFVTGGTSSAYTLTPAPVISAYATGQAFFAQFHTANAAAATININGVAASVLKVRMADGSYRNTLANEIPSGWRSRIFIDNAVGTILLDMPVIQLMTYSTTTGGTSIDFTGIPSGVRRVTVSFGGMSTNGTSDYLFQIGTGASPTTSGYLGSGLVVVNAAATIGTTYTAGVGIPFSSAAAVAHGSITFNLLDPATNKWVASGNGGRSDTQAAFTVGSSISLAGQLNMVRITTTGGVNTFDASSVNVSYE